MAVPSLNVLSLCAGLGGIDLGIRLAVPSARSVCLVEREAAAAALLVRAMEKGWLDPAPMWDDLATFRGRPWRGAVDLVAAGFPCQPWSLAGKRKGTADARWLWPRIVQIIRDVAPALVFLENVPPLLRGGLGFVLRDLSALGFDAEWQVVSAAGVGAPHERARVYLLAHRAGVQLPGLQFADLDGAGQGGEVAHGDGRGRGEHRDRNLPGAGTTLNAAARDRWTTPIAQNAQGEAPNQNADLQRDARLWQTPGTDSFRGRGGERQDEPGLDREARELWQTPNVEGFGSRRQVGATDREPLLEGEAKMWATPRASEDRSGKVSPATMDANSRPLTEQAETGWPTPKADDHQHHNIRGNLALTGASQEWPTPGAEGGTGFMSGAKSDTWRPTLEGAALGKQPSRSGRPAVPRTPNGPRCARCRQRTLRRLQPVFVAWLMGLPECLISDGPWGTPWYRWESRMRSEFSRLVSGW